MRLASRADAAGQMGVPSISSRQGFRKFIAGHWVDSIGNSVLVFETLPETELTVVQTPFCDSSDAKDRVLTIRLSGKYRAPTLGNAMLEYVDEQDNRAVWVTDDGRRNTWCRGPDVDLSQGGSGDAVAFPWLLHKAKPTPWLPMDLPRDVLYDGARVAALLDIRHMIGSNRESQERLTHILMDHDLHPNRGDYLIPGADSPLWRTLPAPDSLLRSIAARILRIPSEALSQNITWSGETEVWVGHHKITCRQRDIQVLNGRWVLDQKDPRKPLEIARLLALYSVFDNPMSNRRNGVHLGLDPDLRRQSDYELFASPLNAAVGNGRFASKWPHVEWRFGSIGSYPTVLQFLPVNSVVCVNPPFTDAYLADVMARLAELKLRFRLRIAIPIQEMPWRKKLNSSLPAAELLLTYYDASMEQHTDVLHPTLLWEDPRCPMRQPPPANGHVGSVCMVPAAVLAGPMARGGTPLNGLEGYADGSGSGMPCSASDSSSPSPVELHRSSGHHEVCTDHDRPEPEVAAPQATRPVSGVAEGLDASEWPALSDVKAAAAAPRSPARGVLREPPSAVAAVTQDSRSTAKAKR